MTLADAPDPFDARLALGVDGALRTFNEAGILSTSDVHVALRLTRLGGATDETVRVGAAFAARAPRLGHVCVDLRTIAETASADTDRPSDLGSLPWPDPPTWVRAMAESPLVGEDRPLHLEGTSLYLDRLWSDEVLVARDLLQRSGRWREGVDTKGLAAGLATFFTGPGKSGVPDLQRMAAATAVLRNVSVVAGGPGTGKTTTVARVLALLLLDARQSGIARIALAAPTGKAAARLQEAVRTEAAAMPLAEELRTVLSNLEGVTLHRLLGFSPGNRTRFRHDRHNRLPHDVVVVDETSMVPLSLMARLVEAVRPDARLILVGDPEQLSSVEAGAVLGDIVGPVSKGLRMSAPAASELALVTGQKVPAETVPGPASFGDGIVVLRRVHRFGGAIAALADAIQRGDADGALAVLRQQGENVTWIDADPAEPGALSDLREVRALAVGFGRSVIEAARAGDADGAIAALGGFRLLCAHRNGPEGVTTCMQHIERWLAAEVDGFGSGAEWYVGRPLLVTENDYALQLYNGDTGVVLEHDDGRLVAAFQRGGVVSEVSPARLAAVDTVYAMTVHKSQGSQFDIVTFLLPGSEARILTRELLYTAVTRARRRMILVGSEDAVRAAIGRPIARASGLRRALWGDVGEVPLFGI